MPCKLDPTIVAMRRLENLKLLARRTGLPALKKAVKAFTGDPPEPDDPAFSLGRYVMAGPGLPDSRGGWTHTDSLYDVRELLDRLAAATGIDPRGLTRGVFVDRGVTPGQAAAHGPGFRGSFNTKTGLTRINADQGIPETELARVIAHEVFGHGGDKALADRDVFDRIVRQATPALFKRLKKQEASAEHMAYAASPVETFARVMEDAVLAQAGIANESPLSRGLSQKVDPTDLAAAMNAAKSGCGRLGRLLNSGWYWLAIRNGWSTPSITSTSPLSGFIPLAQIPQLSYSETYFPIAS
jgi:hypothetical protein